MVDLATGFLDFARNNKEMYRTHRCNSLRKTDIGRQVILAGWVNVTRDHGGVIFIDLRDREGFVEVETPILSKSTPEGARDFLVPSRITPGKFYALPQAPQQYKQLLMVAGVEKYFQIAKSFRDEDLRADRQPEFTQIDIEASFVTPEDIFMVTEGMLAAVFKAARGIDIATPFPRLTYREAIDTFGSDKPDRRIKMELVDLGETFRESRFKVFHGALDAAVVVRAINAKGFAGSTI